jgi:hypothetical protein
VSAQREHALTYPPQTQAIGLELGCLPAPQPQYLYAGLTRNAYKPVEQAAVLRPEYLIVSAKRPEGLRNQSSVKAMMLLPRLKSIAALPPAATTMYCLPPTE